MKVYDELMQNLHEVTDESFIKGMLLEYNINKIFSPIYAFDKAKDVQHFGNVCTSFIILAYSNGCKWLDYNKDRTQVKLEVLKSILDSNKIELDDTWALWFNKIIDGDIEEVERSIYDYVEWQKDRLFTSYITLSTHIALCKRMAMNTLGVNEKMLNDRGKFLSDLPRLEEDLEDIIELIEKRFQNLDESLKQEGKTSISKRRESKTWEEEIAERKK